MKQQIDFASAKVMRSFDYCHFEIVLSSDCVQDEKDVDELRKEAARLADKAVKQYKIAKVNAGRLLNEKYSRQALEARIKTIRDTAEGDRTVRDQAELKAFDDASWNASQEYNYEDEWSDDQEQ